MLSLSLISFQSRAEESYSAPYPFLDALELKRRLWPIIDCIKLLAAFRSMLGTIDRRYLVLIFTFIYTALIPEGSNPFKVRKKVL